MAATCLALSALLGLVGPLTTPVRQPACRAPERAAIFAQATDEKQCVITCSNCKASYAVDETSMGAGAGKRVRCSNCEHEWFQSVVRLSLLPDNMELVEYPQDMKDRLAAGKPAEIRAAFRAYVGNCPFGITEGELMDLFAPFGTVVGVNVMTDEDGRSRGFAFVNMEKVADGLAAVAALDGTDINGRVLAISEGKQQAPGGRGGGDGRGRGRGEFRGRGRGDGRGRGGGRGGDGRGGGPRHFA